MNNPLLLVIGLVFFVLGFFVSRRAKAKQERCTQATTGTVTAVRRSSSADEDGKDSFYPTYAFTANGQEWTLEGKNYSYKRREYQVGQTAQIMYNPENPQEFYVAGAKKQVGFGFMLIVVGMVFCISAFVK